MPTTRQGREGKGGRNGGSGELYEVAVALYGLVAAAVRHSPRDISLTAAATLATLERTGPRRVTDLAASEGVAQPSMTALVTGLERSGLVERRQGSTDLRVVLVSLTPAGQRYLQSRRRAGAEALEQLIEKLSPAEAASLVAAVPALDQLRELDREQRANARARREGPTAEGAGQMDDRSPLADQVKTRSAAGALDTPVVVIGVDGSATSWDAFWWGCGQARRLGGRAVVVFVSPAAEVTAAAIAAAAVPGVMVDYGEVERADGDRAGSLAAEVTDYARRARRGGELRARSWRPRH